MLNGLTECGLVKCHQYWPSTEGSDLDSSTMEQVGLRVTLIEEQAKENFTRRKLLLTDLEVRPSLANLLLISRLPLLLHLADERFS